LFTRDRIDPAASRGVKPKRFNHEEHEGHEEEKCHVHSEETHSIALNLCKSVPYLWQYACISSSSSSASRLNESGRVKHEEDEGDEAENEEIRRLDRFSFS